MLSYAIYRQNLEQSLKHITLILWLASTQLLSPEPRNLHSANHPNPYLPMIIYDTSTSIQRPKKSIHHEYLPRITPTTQNYPKPPKRTANPKTHRQQIIQLRCDCPTQSKHPTTNTTNHTPLFSFHRSGYLCLFPFLHGNSTAQPNQHLTRLHLANYLKKKTPPSLWETAVVSVEAGAEAVVAGVVVVAGGGVGVIVRRSGFL